jgi:hypothetical protein
MKNLINLTGQDIIYKGVEIKSQGEAKVIKTTFTASSAYPLPLKSNSKIELVGLPPHTDYNYLIVNADVRRFAPVTRIDLCVLEEDENGLYLNLDPTFQLYE